MWTKLALAAAILLLVFAFATLWPIFADDISNGPAYHVSRGYGHGYSHSHSGGSSHHRIG
jgi:hypothetical protein